ncbi:hypothetical protein FF38_00610 [Lucilia cuprina]|uniref:DUF4371 domain-containing protein n=1 Tax=Lucilia cuprina TaxID=7375 RepID=A0A0L0C3X5_LUCCU|nr:hypothetical protein FF38_00610 [Lucilia cuprina]
MRNKRKVICAECSRRETKCTNIIKNVLGPHFDDELRKDIGEGYFSILIDESCDVALTKVLVVFILGLAIIYFSSNLGKIVSTFLSIEELESGSAENIVIGVKNALRKFNLKTEKLVGIGTDNANVMDPLKIPKTSDTKWLSIETSVSRILSQWEELKVHFETAYMEEKCLKAKILCELYNEDNIRLYLLFLKPILLEVQLVNKIFQGHDNDPTRLLKELLLLINFLKRKVVGDDSVDVLYSDFD